MYSNKYLKYKSKYLKLKGGSDVHSDPDPDPGIMNYDNFYELTTTLIDGNIPIPTNMIILLSKIMHIYQIENNLYYNYILYIVYFYLFNDEKIYDNKDLKVILFNEIFEKIKKSINTPSDKLILKNIIDSIKQKICSGLAKTNALIQNLLSNTITKRLPLMIQSSCTFNSIKEKFIFLANNVTLLTQPTFTKMEKNSITNNFTNDVREDKNKRIKELLINNLELLTE